MGFRLRLLFGLGVVSGVLLACNAIVGVEDVRLRNAKGLSDDGSVTPPDGTGDSSIIVQGPDRGTLAMGDSHVCARLPTATVKCWGSNSSGQLGDGLAFDAGSRVDPAKVPQAVPGLGDVVDIAAGGGHTCAAKKDGSVVCWGLNNSGELGNDTKDSQTNPTPVALLDHAVAVAAGDFSTCALRDDKTVMCWGANYAGQLGNGNTTEALHAVAVINLGNITSIAAGSSHVCAVDGDANLWCWGRNSFGQLGNGGTNDTSTPVKVPGLTGVQQVSAGNYFTCAVLRSGQVYCWGVDDYGQLGNGTTSPAQSPNPSPISVSLNDATYVWTHGNNHACAVRTNGSLACWGDSTSGQLGALGVDGSVPTPAAVATLTNGQRVWTGGDTSCAITTDGRAWCWGANSFGQIGDNSTVQRTTPTQVSSFP